MASEKSKTSLYFLLIIISTYVILYFFKPELTILSLKFFYSILIKIIPIMIFVFVLMVVINLYVSEKTLVKHLGKKAGVKSYFISIIAGIISTGPIYMWYPMLANLKKKGVSNSSVSIFLYNRAVKPALIPMLVLYFGIAYTITLTLVMVVLSIPFGILMEKFMEVKK